MQFARILGFIALVAAEWVRGIGLVASGALSYGLLGGTMPPEGGTDRLVAIASFLTIALGALDLLLTALVFLFIAGGSGLVHDVSLWVFWVAVVVGLLILAFNYWVWRTEEYLVTNRRMMKVTGVINKRSADSSLEKINDAILEENLLGRILNYGDLDILTAAEVAVDRYRMLNDAKGFKKTMLDAKHKLETGRSEMAPSAGADGNGGPMAGNGRIDTADEVAAALTSLATLRDNGSISPEEYETKKQELLGRL